MENQRVGNTSDIMEPYAASRVKLLENSVLPKGSRPAINMRESARRLSGQTSDRVFSYNAHALHTWLCPSLMMRGALCHVLSSATIAQGVMMMAVALAVSMIFGYAERAHPPCAHLYQPDENGTIPDGIVPLQQCGQFFRNTFLASMLLSMESQLGGLTRFVLGGFVSMALTRTYYSNRSLLGNTFGNTLGAAMSITSCIKATRDEDKEEVLAIQTLLVRWLNAAFLLMFLENAGLVSAKSGYNLLEGSLMPDEWAHIAPLPSRCTYIYQWVGSLVIDCSNWGFVDPAIAVSIYKQVEDLRGCNVWGLPSLPYPYSLIITFMVKSYLLVATLNIGYEMSFYWASFLFIPGGTAIYERVACYMANLLYLFCINVLYQGLLDIHSLLRNPNQDRFIGHLCTQRFLKFTHDVSGNLVRNLDTRPQWQRPHQQKDKAWGRQPATSSVQAQEVTTTIESFEIEHVMENAIV
jgi:hypothetical protein